MLYSHDKYDAISSNVLLWTMSSRADPRRTPLPVPVPAIRSMKSVSIKVGFTATFIMDDIDDDLPDSVVLLDASS